MKHAVTLTSFTALILAAALFGFFYAWVCSTMWGLDTLDPPTAISAMQAMNGSVRNAVFFPAFFLTAPIMALAGLLAMGQGRRDVAAFWGAAFVVTVLAVNLLTFVVHIPMNEALAALGDASTIKDPAQIWADYSPKWQFWNIMRTIASGIAVALVGMALVAQTARA